MKIASVNNNVHSFKGLNENKKDNPPLAEQMNILTDVLVPGSSQIKKGDTKRGVTLLLATAIPALAAHSLSANKRAAGVLKGVAGLAMLVNGVDVFKRSFKETEEAKVKNNTTETAAATIAPAEPKEEIKQV